jgi:hypothetical protein
MFTVIVCPDNAVPNLVGVFLAVDITKNTDPLRRRMMS